MIQFTIGFNFVTFMDHNDFIIVLPGILYMYTTAWYGSIIIIKLNVQSTKRHDKMYNGIVCTHKLKNN